MHIAAAHNTNPTITKAFLDAGANIEAKAELGLTPLHSAAAYNTNNEIIEVLLDAGAQINPKIVLIGWTPLHAAAAYNGNPNIIVTLLDNGADPGEPDSQGKIPSTFYLRILIWLMTKIFMKDFLTDSKILIFSSINNLNK